MKARCGSKPVRQISFELEIKNDGVTPNLGEVYFRTYAIGDEIKDQVAKETHAKIQKATEENPTWTELEVIEKCIGPQKKGYVIGFGGGVKPKDLRGPSTSKAELAKILRQSEAQIAALNDTISRQEIVAAEQSKMMVEIMKELKAMREL